MDSACITISNSMHFYPRSYLKSCTVFHLIIFQKNPVTIFCEFLILHCTLIEKISIFPQLTEILSKLCQRPHPSVRGKFCYKFFLPKERSSFQSSDYLKANKFHWSLGNFPLRPGCCLIIKIQFS